MADPPDDRSPLARAAEWSSRATTIALEMVIPAVVGLWIDRQLGTVMVFLLLGAILGLTAGMWQLIRMATEAQRGEPSDGKSSEHDAQQSGKT